MSGGLDKSFIIWDYMHLKMKCKVILSEIITAILKIDNEKFITVGKGLKLWNITFQEYID